jgi:hypothetical protein
MPKRTSVHHEDSPAKRRNTTQEAEADDEGYKDVDVELLIREF